MSIIKVDVAEQIRLRKAKSDACIDCQACCKT